jgi:ATPase subunit of ABC transporter with duplicated ATPase domains
MAGAELAGLRAGIVLISHDRRLLERFSRSTVLDEGFSAFAAWRDAVLAQEADEQHKLGRKIAMEEGLAALRRQGPAHAQPAPTRRVARPLAR